MLGAYIIIIYVFIYIYIFNIYTVLFYSVLVNYTVIYNLNSVHFGKKGKQPVYNVAGGHFTLHCILYYNVYVYTTIQVYYIKFNSFVFPSSTSNTSRCLQ